MEWEDTVRKLLLADTSDLVELAKLAGRDPKTFYRDANLRGAQVTPDEVATLDLTHAIGAFRSTTPDDSLDQRIKDAQAALEGLSHETHPADWAYTLVHLAALQHKLGLENNDVGPIHGATDLYDLATQVYDKQSRPAQWADTQTRKGSAYADIGRLSGRPKFIREAIDTFLDALTAQSQDKSLRGYANTHLQLGHACLSLSGPADGTRRIKQAIEAFRIARDTYLRYGTTSDILGAEFDLATAYLVMAETTALEIDTAVRHFEALLANRSNMSETLQIKTRAGYGRALLLVGQTGDAKALRDGLDQLSSVLDAYADEENWIGWARLRAYMATGYRVQGNFGSSLDAIEDALTVFKREGETEAEQQAIAVRNEILTKMPS